MVPRPLEQAPAEPAHDRDGPPASSGRRLGGFGRKGLGGGTEPTADESVPLSEVTLRIEDGLLMVFRPDGDPLPPAAFIAAARAQPGASLKLDDGSKVAPMRAAAVLEAQAKSPLAALVDGGIADGWIRSMLGLEPQPDPADADAGDEPADASGVWAAEDTTLLSLDLPEILEAGADGTVDLGVVEQALARGRAVLLSATVAELPAGAALSAGLRHDDGSWSLAADDLPGLSLRTAAGAPGEFALAITLRALQGEDRRKITVRLPASAAAAPPAAGSAGQASTPPAAAAAGAATRPGAGVPAGTAPTRPAAAAERDAGPPLPAAAAGATTPGAAGPTGNPTFPPAAPAAGAATRPGAGVSAGTATTRPAAPAERDAGPPLPAAAAGAATPGAAGRTGNPTFPPAAPAVGAATLPPAPFARATTIPPAAASTGETVTSPGTASAAATLPPGARPSGAPTFPPAAASAGAAAGAVPATTTPLPLAVRPPTGHGVDPRRVAVVMIGGLPAGAALSAGIDNGDGSWMLSPQDLVGLELRLPAGRAREVTLEITALAVTSREGEIARATERLRVALDPDVPPIPLRIDPASVRGLQALMIRDLPPGARLSAGTYDPSIDAWVLLPRQLDGLTVMPAERRSGFTLTVLGIALGADGRAGTRPLTRLPVTAA